MNIYVFLIIFHAYLCIFMSDYVFFIYLCIFVHICAYYIILYHLYPLPVRSHFGSSLTTIPGGWAGGSISVAILAQALLRNRRLLLHLDAMVQKKAMYWTHRGRGSDYGAAPWRSACTCLSRCAACSSCSTTSASRWRGRARPPRSALRRPKTPCPHAWS